MSIPALTELTAIVCRKICGVHLFSMPALLPYLSKFLITEIVATPPPKVELKRQISPFVCAMVISLSKYFIVFAEKGSWRSSLVLAQCP